MALTKIGSIGINTGIQFAGVTTIATLNASDNVLSVGGTVNFVSDVSIGGTVSIAGTLTYEDVTNVDAVGLITARNGIKVGSGITLSSDGNIFATGVTTSTSGIVDSTLTAGRVVFVDSDKSLTDSSTLTYATNGELKILGTGEGGPQVFRDGGNGPDMTLHGSRGTIASPTASAGTDLVGNINFAGYDGSDYHRRASINGIIDGTVVDGSDTLPVAIRFQTGTTSKSERMRITSSGKVGISANDPQVTLDVGGSSSDGLNGLTNSVLYAGFTNNTNFGGVVLGAGANGNTPFIAASKKSDGTALPLDVITGGTSRIRILNTGQVEINGADDEDNLLVKGVGTGFAVHQDDTDGEVSLRAQDVTGSNNAKFMTFFVQKSGESPSEAMRISNTRKVGIATVSPNAQLHVLTTNEAGILIEDSSTGNNAPYLEVMAKRTDGNVHQSFSGQIFLSRNRTEQKISSGLKLGTILFGGNHTNASKSNIAFPASIAGISTGNFDDVNNMPTALTFYTGFTGRTRLQSNVSSGVERMRISPEGYITKPYQPACTVHQLGGPINTNGEANRTEVVFTNTITNRGSHYNTSNGRFTCPVGGVYHVSAGFLTRKGSATNAFHNVHVYKNGSDTALKARDINNANELHITVLGIIDCNAGDYLSIYVSNDGGDFWSDYNYFSVHLIG